MIKKIFTWMGYILSAAAFVTLVSTWAIKRERLRIETLTLESKVDKLLVSDSIRTIQWENYVESQDQFRAAVLDSITYLSREQRAFRRSYVQYVQKNTQSTDEIREYLKGITWEEKKNLNPLGMFPSQ